MDAAQSGLSVVLRCAVLPCAVLLYSGNAFPSCCMHGTVSAHVVIVALQLFAKIRFDV